MNKTKIEYADWTWNPFTGCNNGCSYCYARRLTEMRGKIWGYDFKPRFHESRLDDIKKIRNGSTVFVCDMGDMFDPANSFGDIKQVWEKMIGKHLVTFLLLTKRPDVAAAFARFLYIRDEPNIWWGTTVTCQRDVDIRVPQILSIPGNHWLSCEPLVEEIELPDAFLDGPQPGAARWVVAGGMSGPNAWPCHPDWVRKLREQCKEANIPFFFKQWGAWMPIAPIYDDTDCSCEVSAIDAEYDYCYEEIQLENNGEIAVRIDGDGRCFGGYQPSPSLNPWLMIKAGKKKAGRLLDGAEYNAKPF